MEVLVTSPWVPREWIRAHGLEPRGAWFAQLDPSGALPEGVCAFAGAMARLHQAQPHAGIVFTTACDQMRRAADATASSGGKHAFLFSLPATWQTSAARKLYHAEVARLGKYLESLGGHTPGEEELMREIRRSEAQRAHRRRILEAGSSSDRGVPVALVGGPLLPSQWSLFDAVEAAGGRVVLNATEPGERSGLLNQAEALRETVYAAAGAPLPALEMLIAEMLAVHFRSDRDESRVVLGGLVQEATRRVEAVVVSRIPGASHCAWEGAYLREHLAADLGVPAVEIEVPPVCDALLPALRTRLQAVLEIAQSRRRA